MRCASCFRFGKEDILKGRQQGDQTVRFSFVEGDVRLRVEDIVYIETSRHKNVFYTTGGTYNIYRKMDELEADLHGMGFVRTHRSFLVNMRYIDRINSYIVTLVSGKELSVPKARYPDVKRQYALFQGIKK